MLIESFLSFFRICWLCFVFNVNVHLCIWYYLRTFSVFRYIHSIYIRNKFVCVKAVELLTVLQLWCSITGWWCLVYEFNCTTKMFQVVCVVTAGFDALRDELGSSRASSVHHGLSLDVSYDEQDMVKVSIKTWIFFLFLVNMLGLNLL